MANITVTEPNNNANENKFHSALLGEWPKILINERSNREQIRVFIYSFFFLFFWSPGLCTYETKVELGLQWLVPKRTISDFITSNYLVFCWTCRIDKSQLEVEIIA